MAGRQLKVYQAHLGFYDTVVAAPSQKAALSAWGAGHNEFAKGFAKVTTDPAATRAALNHPGQVLRRPFGGAGEYKLEADPVPAPKPSARHIRATAAAKRRRQKTRDEERRAAEQELRDARRKEARALEELKAREQELAREKAAVRQTAKARTARAMSRLARSK